MDQMLFAQILIRYVEFTGHGETAGQFYYYGNNKNYTFCYGNSDYR